MNSTAREVFQYFRQKGLSPQQAAGVVGNTQQESSNNPNAPGGGLIQGQGGRTSSGSLHQQLEGVWRELQGPERGTLGALKGAHDARTAARIFSERFERPGIPMLGNRERYALEALKNFGGAQGQAATAPQQAAPGKEQAPEGEQAAALIAQLSQPRSQVEQFKLPMPGLEGGEAGGPKLPAPLPEPEQSTPALLAALGEREGGGQARGAPAAAGRGASQGTGPAHVTASGKLGGLLPAGAKLNYQRIDEGQDGETNPGGPIIANGNGFVVAVKSDPNGFGPEYPVVRFNSGPLAGKELYIGHTKTALHAGQHFTAGQPIAHTGPNGYGNAAGKPGWFEIGESSTLGQGNQGQGQKIARLLR